MKNSIPFLIFVVVVIGLWYIARVPNCIEGEISSGVWSSGDSYEYECKNEIWVMVSKTEVEKAIEAKRLKAEYNQQLTDKKQFCGEDNVDEINLVCKDYALVPDDNLK